MSAERDGREESARRLARLAILAAAILLCLRGTALAVGLVSTKYTLNWDQNVEKKATDTNNVSTFKHALDLGYKGFLSPIVENEITLKIEQEVKSDADPKSTTRIFPTINLSYKGSYWNAGAKRTIEDSNEPDTSTKITDSYFLELFYKPPRMTLPDLKAKYTLDQDYESGATDINKHGVTLSSIYLPMEWVELQGEYKRDVSDDNLNADSDTEDETYSGTIGIRHFISDKIKVSSEFKTEVSRGATLLDAGGATDQTEDQTHTWKNMVAFKPFRNTTIDGSYDFDLKQNMTNGEHTYIKKWKAAVSQKVSILDLKGDFSREINETRHTDDDNKKIVDTWTIDGKVRFSKMLDITAKYQTKDTEEVYFEDSSKDLTSRSVTQGATWTGELTPFWKASVSYDKTDTIDQEVTTTVDTKSSYQSTFDFKGINLTLNPTYDITETEDYQVTPTETTKTKDFRFKIAWKVLSTNNMEAKVDHTYGRKTDSGAGTIERTDDSTGNLTWIEPMPGWNLGFDVNRSANDTSEDDQPPDITTTFGFKVDYKHERFNWNMSYKYDKKKLTDNSEAFDFKIGWVSIRWDLSLTYSFNKTFSAELDEDHSIGIAFQCTL